MNGFRKWTISLCAKFDELLGQVENHEALASHALLDMKESLARANGQLSRVHRDCRILENDARSAEQKAAEWKTRAAREASDERAIECLRRARAQSKEAETLRARLSEQSQMRDQVVATVRSLEQKYLDLNGKRRLLSTRQAATEAAEAVNAESGTSVDVEDVFSRWESKLSERDFIPGASSGLPDDFAAAYLEAEEKDSLLSELTSLRNNESPGDSNSNEKNQGNAS